MGIIEIVRKHTLEQARQQARLEERAKTQQLLKAERAKVEAERVKAERAKNKAVARDMLKDGIPMETIVKYLGLSVEEIEELK